MWEQRSATTLEWLAESLEAASTEGLLSWRTASTG